MAGLFIEQEEFETKYKLYKESYDKGEPVIDDDEFDAFEAMGKDMFPNSEVFNIVGMEGAVKVVHDIPMMSLTKLRNLLLLQEWIAKRKCIVTYKLDGAAGSIKYVHGTFMSGATRGNGVLGQDITSALQYINFPKTITEEKNMEVRGEFVISKDNFILLNEDLKSRGLKPAKSKRNIIPGLISPVRTANHDLAKYVDFVVYDILADVLFSSEENKFKYLKNLGFVTPVVAITNDCGVGVEDIIEWYKTHKNTYKYLTDGLVITYDDTMLHDRTDRNPTYKMAYKLEGEIASTPLLDIVKQVSGHGVVNFVGVVEPVELNEATIGRVTLHNIDYIKSHNINIGAVIGITRSGDIIPTHVTTFIPNGVYTPPTNCPVCDSALHKDGAFLICENSDCDSKRIGKITKWIDIIDAKGVSGATIKALYDNGIIKTTSDLYKMKKEDIEVLDGFGKSSANIVVNSIKQASQKITHEMIIRGTYIRNIGKSVSKELIDNYGSVPNMYETMNYHDLEMIAGIGDETATLLLRKKEDFCSFYREMTEVIQITEKSVNSDILQGMSFCITGTLSKGRNEFKEMVEQNSGIVRSSVSKKLDYLIAGVNAGSKEVKAEKLRVTILTEEDFMNLLNNK